MLSTKPTVLKNLKTIKWILKKLLLQITKAKNYREG